jgi:hypothetical protein
MMYDYVLDVIPSEESERSCICVEKVSISPLSSFFSHARSLSSLGVGPST